MDTRVLERIFFAALLVVAVFAAWLVLGSFLGALVLAGTLALIFRPVYNGLCRAVRFPGLAALLTVIVVIVIVFIPLALFGTKLFGEMTGLYTTLSSHQGDNLSPMLMRYLHDLFPNTQFTLPATNVNGFAQQMLAWLIGNVGSVFSSVASMLLLTFLSLLGLFYFLKDGARLKEWLLEFLPLTPTYTERIVSETESALSSVVKGTLVVAVIQGVIAGIGFFIFGVPNAIFWGMLAIITTLIPLIGTWLVVVPAIVYLLLIGHAALAVGLAIWSLVLVNLAYDILAPHLMHRGLDIHPFIILLSVIGGIRFFGPIGFLIGPFVMALLFSLLRIYPKLILKQ